MYKLGGGKIYKNYHEFYRRGKKIELQLEKLARGDEDINSKKDLLLTIPGIGKTTALLLLSKLRELGTLSKNQIVALACLGSRK